jgi:hypothetical protein
LIAFLCPGIVALYLAELSHAVEHIGPAAMIIAIKQMQSPGIALLRF